jgi:hypothetical protein
MAKGQLAIANPQSAILIGRYRSPTVPVAASRPFVAAINQALWSEGVGDCSDGVAGARKFFG